MNLTLFLGIALALILFAPQIVVLWALGVLAVVVVVDAVRRWMR